MSRLKIHVYAAILVLAAAVFINVCMAEEPEKPAAPAKQEQQLAPHQEQAAEPARPDWVSVPPRHTT